MGYNQLLTELKQKYGSKTISCICLTCGVRNDHSTDNAYCQNGHDDWLEYWDVLNMTEDFDRAKRVFKLGTKDLTEAFANPDTKQIKIWKD